MVQTTWPASLQLPTAGWPPGIYLVRLDSAAGQRFVPLTVRSPDMRGKVVLIAADTTWQAYNDWGGFDLYHGPAGLDDFAERSTVVSFDRPYAGDGSAGFARHAPNGLACHWPTSATSTSTPSRTYSTGRRQSSA
jgi:hypothetical protein